MHLPETELCQSVADVLATSESIGFIESPDSGRILAIQASGDRLNIWDDEHPSFYFSCTVTRERNQRHTGRKSVVNVLHIRHDYTGGTKYGQPGYTVHPDLSKGDLLIRTALYHFSEMKTDIDVVQWEEVQ